MQYALDWQAAEKIVYSTSLGAVSSARTRIERAFDPDAVRRLKAEAKHDLTVNGPTLAAQMIAAGLVDEYHLFLTPRSSAGGHASSPTASGSTWSWSRSGRSPVAWSTSATGPAESGRLPGPGQSRPRAFSER